MFSVNTRGIRERRKIQAADRYGGVTVIALQEITKLFGEDLIINPEATCIVGPIVVDDYEDPTGSLEGISTYFLNGTNFTNRFLASW